MTHDPDEPNGPEQRGQRDEGSDRRLDEDAAWRAIVENYGERPDLGPEPPADSGRSRQPSESDQAREQRNERLRGLFRPAWDEPRQTEASWDDEGHFVPPSPPPMPVLDPRRRLAWAGLFGSPLLMLVAVVLGWRFPDWLMLLLALSFAGGFIYLVATMSERRPDDGSGDDGAVV